MFDQRQKKAYENIYAPKDLRAKVLYAASLKDQKKPFYSFQYISRYAAAAACLLAVVTLMLYAPAFIGPSDLTLNGTGISSEYMSLPDDNEGISVIHMRSEDVYTVELGLKLKREAEIKLSEGNCEIVDAKSGETVEKTKRGEFLLRWNIPEIDSDTVYVLTVKEGSYENIYELTYDSVTADWRIRKIEK